MRRDIWLAAVAGMIVGSWLTLAAAQAEETVKAPEATDPARPASTPASTEQPSSQPSKAEQQQTEQAPQAAGGTTQKAGDSPKPDAATKPVQLAHPSSDRAGVLTLGDRSVQLSGIIPTDVGRMCAGSDGTNWPCGTAARTAFRMYLRGRTIDCDLPSETWQGTATASCRYVRVDLSEWLVRFGWVEPEPGSPLAAVAEQAKEQKRGIYGDDPRKGHKSTLAPAPAKEDPLNPI
ncbi:MAG: thermonuclease family protein [Rhizobium sp.]